MGQMVVMRGRKAVTALVVATVAVMVFGGCATSEQTELVLPQAFASIETPGQVRSTPEHSLSPDGKYILATMSDDGGAHLVLLQLGAEGSTVIEIDSVGRNWLEQAFFSYQPIGWISETRFLCAKVGWQPSGSNKDQRGVILAVGDASTRSFEETAFIPLPSSGVRTLYVPDRAKAFVDCKTSIWEFDTVQKSLRLVRTGLPDSPYLNPVPSPTGAYYVYPREDEGREGLYILDTATGEERTLMPNGETRSFYPSWSFDGKYIAVYTVGRKPGAAGTTWHSYDVFEGEDMAQPVGQAITVLDPQGKVVSSIKVEGKYVTSFLWAGNAHNIALMAGTRQPRVGPPSISTDSLWMTRIGGTGQSVPRTLAVIPKNASGGFLTAHAVAFDVAGEGVYYDVYEKGVWYARESAEPVRVAEGSWWGAWAPDAPRPVIWDGVVALVDEAGPKRGLYLMSDGTGIRFAEHPRTRVWVLAYDKSRLVIFAGSPVPQYPGPGHVIAYSVPAMPFPKTQQKATSAPHE
jgi:hypothetical protein